MGKKLKFNLKGSNLSRRCNSSINSSKKNNSTTVGSSSRSSRNHARLHRVHFKHMKAHNNRRCRTIVVARKTRSLYHSLQQLFTSGGRMQRLQTCYSSNGHGTRLQWLLSSQLVVVVALLAACCDSWLAACDGGSAIAAWQWRGRRKKVEGAYGYDERR